MFRTDAQHLFVLAYFNIVLWYFEANQIKPLLIRVRIAVFVDELHISLHVLKLRTIQGRRKHFDIGAASVKDNAISHS